MGEAVPLLTFAESTLIGQQLHDHWEKMAGQAPLGREDQAWGHVVRHVLMLAADAVDSRDGGDG